MEHISLFPFGEYWLFYVLFTVFVLLILSLDLGVFHRHAHEVKFKEALSWSVVWVALALVFNFLFYKYSYWQFSNNEVLLAIKGFDPEVAAKNVGLEFLTGYIIEKALAVDNIFVFVVVFSFFAIPAKYQHRILFFGIIGALIFRIIFIALGSVLIQYEIVVIIFGIFLLLTGIKILFSPEKQIDPAKNPVIIFLKNHLPIHPSIDDQSLFKKKERVLYVTPLFLALIFIELSDIIFAVDSVPAIFAVTKEPLVVFTSNIFAILGLRAMFFLLAGIVDKFRYLKYGLGIVLVFVGLKMAWLNELYDGKFPIMLSLGIIVAIISVSIVLSLVIKQKHPHV
ncbi:MAG: TerC/Alx family metal homeostasis membrane protein [bacterium]